MNIGGLVILTGLYSVLLFLMFRVEAKHRVIVAICVLLALFMVHQYSLGHNAETEGWVALGLGVILNFLFWLFIGRYNPARSDDEIKVIGLDD
jgi:hypothetical protein